MRVSILAGSLALATLATAVQAQSCLLYYKFDRGTGTEAINYGSASVTSTMRKGSTGPSSPWVSPGKYGANMLRGSLNNTATDLSVCETGFTAGFTGDFTVHWWMKERNTLGTGLTYAWGGLNSFRCFTNGVAGTGLWIRAWNGTSENIVMPTVGATLQVRARAAAGVCVGCVVKTVGTTTSAQWYIDGVAHGAAQTTFTAAPTVASSTSDFKIGKHTSDSSTAVWDIDDYRLCNFAATPAQIAAWCTAPTAAFGPYDQTCTGPRARRITLSAAGGTPKLGNSAYSHTIQGPAEVMKYIFVAGDKMNPAFDIGAPYFPTLAGCLWHVNFDIVLLGTTSAAGAATIANAIPTSTALIGLHADAQVFGETTGSAPNFHSSNPVNHVIEAN